MPLVDLEKGRDDVYGWLELVFPFCEGKPFVYYSQYVPSARIHALARSHKVRLRWCPLSRLSAPLLARHRLLAPALAGRQSVAEVAGAPGGARRSRSREARGARWGGTSSGRPASAQAVRSALK